MNDCVDNNPDSIPGSATMQYQWCLVELTTMEWLVHLTTHRKNSPVQFVPNRFETKNTQL